MILAAATPLSGNWQFSPGTALLAVGGLLLYVASRAGADALAGPDPDRPGLRALGHCLPIAVVALLCLNPAMGRPGVDHDTIGRPQIAVGLLFGSSVATLTLVLGVASYLAPLTSLSANRKAWPFVLPVALLALVAGFNGEFTWLHAGAFAVLGGAVANLWAGTRAEGVAQDAERHAYRMTGASWAQFALSLALTVLGGWAVARGVARLEQTHRILTGVLLAGAVLAPLLTLPVISSVSRVAERGHTGSVVSTLVAMVLINLCVVLPIIIFAHYGLATLLPLLHPSVATTVPSTAPAPIRGPVPFPLICWRVDSVVLAVMGFAMIPWAAGRWAMSRFESIALIFVYAIYLALIAFVSTRWR